MYIDALLLLSDAQAYSATAFSTNTVDLGTSVVARDLGNGEPMSLVYQVDVSADITTGDETYRLDLVQSANANLSSPDVLESRTIAAANLTLGTIGSVPIPIGAITKRYVGLQLTLGGTTPTITLTAWFGPTKLVSLAKPTAYASAIKVS